LRDIFRPMNWNWSWSCKSKQITYKIHGDNCNNKFKFCWSLAWHRPGLFQMYYACSTFTLLRNIYIHPYNFALRRLFCLRIVSLTRNVHLQHSLFVGCNFGMCFYAGVAQLYIELQLWLLFTVRCVCSTVYGLLTVNVLFLNVYLLLGPRVFGSYVSWRKCITD
jgi:hypothetical protein